MPKPRPIARRTMLIVAPAACSPAATRRPRTATGRRQSPSPAPGRVCRSRFSSTKPGRASTRALDADIGFVERLVWFWSNHFCVSADKDRCDPSPARYEREAIRPHVLGRFADMLLAAESHPAMLLYLDNAQSIGPNSVAGMQSRQAGSTRISRARSSNCIRSACAPVYTQADVTNFAKVMTGWTDRAAASNPDHGGEFVFNPRMHEPGAQTVIGKTYPDAGVEQGRAVLADLARHPATAKHIATKLARHFIADEPPPALVERLAKRFLDTDGDLKECREGAGRRRPKPGTRAQPSSSGRANGSSPRCARPMPSRATSRPLIVRASLARRAAVAAAGAEGIFRRQRRLARRPGAAARHRQS